MTDKLSYKQIANKTYLLEQGLDQCHTSLNIFEEAPLLQLQAHLMCTQSKQAAKNEYTNTSQALIKTDRTYKKTKSQQTNAKIWQDKSNKEAK